MPDARIKERRRRGTLVSPARGKEVVLLTKELLEQVTIAPGRGDTSIGAAFVSIGGWQNDDVKLNAGRDDSGDEGHQSGSREVRTTGWVVVRFIPHPTGIRWLLTSNPLPPLLILPPLSLSLTIASALIGFVIISFCFGGRKLPVQTKNRKLITNKGDRSEFDADVARRTDLERVWDARARQQHDEAWDMISNRSRSRSHSPQPPPPETAGRSGQVLRVVRVRVFETN